MPRDRDAERRAEEAIADRSAWEYALSHQSIEELTEREIVPPPPEKEDTSDRYDPADDRCRAELRAPLHDIHDDYAGWRDFQ